MHSRSAFVHCLNLNLVANSKWYSAVVVLTVNILSASTLVSYIESVSKDFCCWGGRKVGVKGKHTVS